MKVLMTADAVGGVWTYAIELTRALAGVDFVLATMGALPSDAQRAELPPNVTLAASDFRLEWEENPWDDVARAGAWLQALAREHEPDLVHLNGYAHAALAFDAPKLVVAHSCVLSWWHAVKGEEAPASWQRYREVVEEGLRGADLVVAPSAAMLGALDQHYRFDTPARVIHNGRSAAPSRAEPRAARRSIFAAGRLWDEAKNLRAVVAAAPGLRWPVRIAGEGGTSSTNVTHLGRLDRNAMQRELDAAGIYLFPAVYEPFGLSILEAALAGCALVVGDIGSLRELWDGAALFVDPHDDEAIVATVNTLTNDPARLAALAQAARHRAARYTPAAMAAAYARLYAQLCAPATAWEASA